MGRKRRKERRGRYMYCRVCAKKMNKGYKHLCSSSGSLLECFGVNVASDKCNIHPSHYCHNCHNIAKRLQKAGAESTLRTHSRSVHDDVQCEVCNMCSPLHTGGRQKKENKKRGKPSMESNKAIANAIIQNAPKSWKATQPLSLSHFLPPLHTDVVIQRYPNLKRESKAGELTTKLCQRGVLWQ